MPRRYSSEYKAFQPYVVEDARSVANAVLAGAAGGGTGGGVTDHGALTGLGDDDHPGYLTAARGDARYIPATRTLTAGAGLTGGGDLSADRTFAVGAGLGITVNADDVALASSVAGAGLTYTTGVLAVGVANTGAAGLTVEADAVRLTSSSNPGIAASILASDTNGALTLHNGYFAQGAQSSAVFASGFAGSGWRADYGITTVSRASIETDDLTVRGRLRVYELLIQQIRATNGSLLVTSSSKVVTASGSANPLWTVNGSQLTFNGSNATLTFTLYTIATSTSGEDAASKRTYHGFLTGDIIRAQQVEWNGSAFGGVIQSNLEVTSVTNLYTYKAAFVSGDAPAVGYDFVRLGSTSDSSRRGVVYLTSDDSAAPFIDIVDGVSYHSNWNTPGAIKARLGKLSGITDSDFGGALSGYGLYSTNVYLKGNIYATSGIFAGSLSAATGTFAGSLSAATGSFSGTVTAAAGSIGGWTLGATSLTAGSGATTVGLDSGGTNPAIYAGSATPASAPFRVTAAGALTATSATITGSILASSGGISGNFYVGSDVGASGNLYVGSNGNMRFSSDGARAVLEANTANTIPKSSSAYRWFSDISISSVTAAASTTNYCGFIGNQHTGLNTVDLVLTSYVGNASAPNGYQTLNARTVLQAGHYDGTYTDARVEVVREAGSGLRYVGIYGDRLEVNGAIGAATMTAPGASWASGSLIYTDTADGDLKVRFANGTIKVLATN